MWHRLVQGLTVISGERNHSDHRASILGSRFNSRAALSLERLVHCFRSSIGDVGVFLWQLRKFNSGAAQEGGKAPKRDTHRRLQYSVIVSRLRLDCCARYPLMRLVVGVSQDLGRDQV